MILLPYKGTWIACGAYAFLNATEMNPSMLIDIENSAGATFGMSSMGCEWDYTRLLTPTRDFNCGIDAAATIWGFEIRRNCFHRSEELCTEEWDDEAVGYLIGPLNMEYLSYLPLSRQYRNSDHYIALKKYKSRELVLIDSEGITGMHIVKDDLKTIVRATGIPESNGIITLRSIFRQSEKRSEEERISFTVNRATRNFDVAGFEGGGSNAFLTARDAILDAEPAKWREAFSYDLNYVVQRRLMMMHLFKQMSNSGLYREMPFLTDVALKQIEIAGRCLSDIQSGDKLSISMHLNNLSELEGILMSEWKEWTM